MIYTWFSVSIGLLEIRNKQSPEKVAASCQNTSSGPFPGHSSTWEVLPLLSERPCRLLHSKQVCAVQSISDNHLSLCAIFILISLSLFSCLAYMNMFHEIVIKTVHWRKFGAACLCKFHLLKQGVVSVTAVARVFSLVALCFFGVFLA